MPKPGDASLFLGKLIKRRRKELNLSQEELAASSGLHRTYIGLLEQGKRSPTINTLFMVARALHVKPSELFRDIEDGL